MRNRFHSFLIWLAQHFMIPTTPGWRLGALHIDIFKDYYPGEQEYETVCIYLLFNWRCFVPYYHKTLLV